MSEKVGYIYSKAFLGHRPVSQHVENPQRVEAIHSGLREEGIINQLVFIEPYRIPFQYLTNVHTQAHIETIEHGAEMAGEGNYSIYPDTYVSSDSYDVAMLAAGGICAGIDSLYHGEVSTVFSASRPPGHHANQTKARGFCLFNNAAIGARYAQEQYDAERVLIIDWDVHHGNGTQEIFYRDPSVSYVSIHQFPGYPGTGARTETGEGEGKGYTHNFPLFVGSGDSQYRRIFDEHIKGIVCDFNPDLLIISAGFDAHENDPIGSMNVTTPMYKEMTDKLRQYTNGKPILSVLEGGYNLHSLSEAVGAHVSSLLGK